LFSFIFFIFIKIFGTSEIINIYGIISSRFGNSIKQDNFHKTI